MQEYRLSQAKIDELTAELDERVNVTRPQAIERTAIARAFGDLSENAEYHASREAQARNEGRIEEIKEILKHAVLVERKGGSAAELGATVTLKKSGADDHVTYTLVSAQEADMAAGRLSVDSPLGSCVVGKSAGHTCSVETPRGSVEYTIISIS